MQSDGQSPANPDALIDVDVPAGPEYLEVENLGGASTYTLTASLTPSSTPFQPIPISAVDHPVAIVAGDFNGDGRTDLAVANSGSDDVSVLLGNGDGTFQPQVTYAVGSEPDALVAGDFNGDGRTDLAVANAGSNDVSVLLGNGDGTFQTQVTYAVGTAPSPSWRATSTATAGPTWPSPTTATNDVSVLAGQRRRHLPDPGDLRGGVRPRRPRGGRLHRRRPDRPGRRQQPVRRRVGVAGQRRRHLPAPGDLRGGDRAQTPSWPATSTATAGPTWPSPTPARQRRVGAAGQRRRHLPAPGDLRGGDSAHRPRGGDFNGDGRTDLAVANEGSNDVSVLLGNGDGTFQPQVTYAVGSIQSAS